MIIPFWIPFHFLCFFLTCKCGQSLPGTSCSVRSPGPRGDLQLIPPLPWSQRWEQMYRGKNEQLIAENLIYNPKRTCADIKPRLQRTFLKNLFKSDPHMLKIFPSYQSSIEAPIKRWLSSHASPLPLGSPAEEPSVTCTLIIYEHNHQSCATNYCCKTISPNLLS